MAGVRTSPVPFVYTAAAAPVVTSVSPASGPLTGGINVAINGSGFQPGITVKFGTDRNGWLVEGVSAPVVSVTASQVVVTAPPLRAAGIVRILVKGPDKAGDTS